MSGLRILVVDDHEIVRRGISEVVESRGNGWQVCGEAVNGKDAISKVNELKPDLTLLDVSMPIMNGLDATRQILQQGSASGNAPGERRARLFETEVR